MAMGVFAKACQASRESWNCLWIPPADPSGVFCTSWESVCHGGRISRQRFSSLFLEIKPSLALPSDLGLETLDRTELNDELSHYFCRG